MADRESNATHIEDMDVLHRELSKFLRDELKKARTAEDPKGKAALANVIRQFLNDNKCFADTSPKGKRKGSGKAISVLEADFDFENVEEAFGTEVH
jgi:hypothetical protein